jgi:hypothetical protein
LFSPEEYGEWRFCDDGKLFEVVERIPSRAKLAVMMDSHKSAAEDILPKKDSLTLGRLHGMLKIISATSMSRLISNNRRIIFCKILFLKFSNYLCIKIKFC